MCGIIGVFNYGSNKESASEKALEMMDEQISRGNRGFGAVIIDDKGKFQVKRATDEVKLLVDVNLNPSRMVMIHHRMPTSSPNEILQTHPIKVEHKDFKHGYLVMHNGVISNHKELKAEHEKAGFKYTTDDGTNYNDSESLAIEIAQVIEGQSKVVNAQGSSAFLILQYNIKTELATQVFYGRDANIPLKLAKSRDVLRISSEGGGEEIKPNMLYHFNLTDFNIKKQALSFAAKKEDIGFKSFADHETTTIITPKNTNSNPNDYNCDLDDDDIDTEWELSMKLDDNKEVISNEIEELFNKLTSAEDVWTVKINDEIKTLIGMLVTEVQRSHKTAVNFHSQALMKEAEQEMDQKELDKSIITENDDAPHPIAKYYSR